VCDPTDTDADADGCVYPFDEDTCFASLTRGECLFDLDPSTALDDFRVLFTPDQNIQNTYKNNASNPGQFFYNTFFVGDGSGGVITVMLPYPFVTQGNMPIHIYDGVIGAPSMEQECMGEGCYVPGLEIASSDEKVALGDYGPSPSFGDMVPLTVEIPPGVNFAYVRIHLDWGLKITNNYAKDATDNDALDATTMALRIPNMYNYTFSDDSVAFNGGGSDMCHQNLNVFKKNPGIGGLVQNSSADSLKDVKVQIYQGTKLTGTVYTDEDGWYMWNYKYTGKAATFTIKLPDKNGLTKTATLKSNGFVVVNFENVP
jgi:hypothetical protein